MLGKSTMTYEIARTSVVWSKTMSTTVPMLPFINPIGTVLIVDVFDGAPTGGLPMTFRTYMTFELYVSARFRRMNFGLNVCAGMDSARADVCRVACEMTIGSFVVSYACRSSRPL